MERLRQRLTVHTYNEQIAQRIYGNLPRYAALMEHWLKRMEGRLEKGT